MKDITIKGQFIIRELYLLLGCFVVMFAVNVGSIIYYHRPWIEMFSQIGFVIVLTLALFILLSAAITIFGWIYILICKLIKK